MTTLKLIIVFVFFALYSCGQKDSYSKVDVKVARLTNKIIPLVNHVNNPDSCKKALLYLDSATLIDTNCFLCYYNKLMFLSSLKQTKRLFSTIDTCIKLRPDAHDLYLTAGILHESSGDTVLSKTYFKKSLAICNSVLDTMNANNRDYAMLTTNKAINLIMLGDSIQANKLLKHLYDTQQDDLQFDNVEKKYTLSLMNKSKAQLLDTLSNSEKYSR